MGLDKTSQGYQEEGVIKLLKDIRDGLVGGVIRPNRPNDDGRPNGPNDDDRPNRPNDDDYDSFDTTSYDTPYTSDDEDDEDDEDDAKKIYNNLLFEHFKLRKNIKEIKDNLDKKKR